MNPYTSMWTGVTPGDGPQEVHVVLLDNGRTDALADPVGRQALRCIRCSACLNVCPVYERAGGHAYGSVYPGPIGAILTPQLRGVGHDPATDASLPFASTLCGACFEVCPVRIDIPEVLVHLRGKVVDAHRGGTPSGTGLAMRGAGWATGRAGRMAALQRLAGMAGSVLGRTGRRTGADRRASAGPAALAGQPLVAGPGCADPCAGVLPGLVAAYVGRCRRGSGPRRDGGRAAGRAARSEPTGGRDEIVGARDRAGRRRRRTDPSA